MRFLLVLAALLFVPLTIVALTTQAAAAAGSPALKVIDRTPLTIEGRGFAKQRDVKLTVQAPGVLIRRTVRASASGRFSIAIGSLSLTGPLRCAVGVVIAARSQASGLVLWHQIMPGCSPPLRPPA